MNRIIGFLLLVVLLAILKAVVVVLAIALLLALTYSLIKQPKETLAFLAFLGLGSAAGARPGLAIVASALVCVAVVVAGAKRKSLGQGLLIDGLEDR